MNKLRVQYKQGVIAAIALFLMAFPLQVLAVEFGAGIELAEIYTSNLFLDPDDSAQSEFITEIRPFIGLSHDGERIEYDIDYSLQMLIYAGDSDLNGAYSELASLAFVNLIDEVLRFRGLARITQVNIDPQRKVSGGNYNITQNRSDATRWEIGPDWNQSLWGRSEVDSYYYAGNINYEDPNTSDVDTQRGQFV